MTPQKDHIQVRHDPIGSWLGWLSFLGHKHWVDTSRPGVTGTGWAYSKPAGHVGTVAGEAEAWWRRSTKCLASDDHGAGCLGWRWHRGPHCFTLGRQRG